MLRTAVMPCPARTNDNWEGEGSVTIAATVGRRIAEAD
jgi:hypothetical protein